MSPFFPSPKPDYSIVEKEANEKNLATATKRLNALAAHDEASLSKTLTRQERTKFRGISERHGGMSTFELVQEASQNPAAMRYLANDFSKASRRQGVHEKLAGAYLGEHLQAVSGTVQTLPKAGPESIMLTDAKNAKSLDFIWELEAGGERLVGVATHKYTKESGGAQDHQCKELQRFVDLAATNQGACIDKIKAATGATAVMVVAIGDGPYYEKGPGRRALDGMKTSGSSAEGATVVAGHIQEIPQAWGRFVASRLPIEQVPEEMREFVEEAAQKP